MTLFSTLDEVPGAGGHGCGRVQPGPLPGGGGGPGPLPPDLPPGLLPPWSDSARQKNVSLISLYLFPTFIFTV